MKSRDFCYWLQGFFEISEASILGVENDRLTTRLELSPAKVQVIRKHLNMVFKHEIDPSHGDAAHQAELSAAHEGGAAGDPPKLQPFQVGYQKPPGARC